MKKIRTLSYRYSLLFAVVTSLLFAFFNNYLSPELYRALPDTLFYEGVYKLIGMLWPVFLALIFGYGFIFTQKGFGSTFKMGGIFFVYFAIAISTPLYELITNDAVNLSPIPNCLIGLITLIAIGIREEVIFRGIIANAIGLQYSKSRMGVWTTAIVSSFLFGFMHMINIRSGASVTVAIVQSLNAAAIGLVFAAIYLRGGSIWAVALLHTLADTPLFFVTNFTTSTATDIDQINTITPASLFSLPIFVLVAIFLLRKSKLPAVIERFDSLRVKLSA